MWWGSGVTGIIDATEKSCRSNSYVYNQLTLDKDASVIAREKDNALNKWCWKNWIFTCKRSLLRHLILIPDTKYVPHGPNT